jgi:hypothetical protein
MGERDGEGWRKEEVRDRAGHLEVFEASQHLLRVQSKLMVNKRERQFGKLWCKSVEGEAGYGVRADYWSLQGARELKSRPEHGRRLFWRLSCSKVYG